MKKCSTCKETKPYSEFSKGPRYADGYMGQCKFCVNEKRKERKDSINAKQRKYYRKNKQYYITKAYLRNKQVARAKPAWLTEEHEFMLEEIYELRDLRSKLTGVVHHVDHIVPLRGQNCCGLHVPWNLQVIPALDNLSKSNRI
jgi:hypothetical protein